VIVRGVINGNANNVGVGSRVTKERKNEMKREQK